MRKRGQGQDDDVSLRHHRGGVLGDELHVAGPGHASVVGAGNRGAGFLEAAGFARVDDKDGGVVFGAYKAGEHVHSVATSTENNMGFVMHCGLHCV